MELTDFHPATATIKTEDVSGRIGDDVSATVSYQEGRGFTLTWGIVAGPKGPPIETRQLTDADLVELLAKIKAAVAEPPATIELSALEAFQAIVERNVEDGASVLFRSVRFGQAMEEVFGGTVTVTGHVSFGIDVVGTIHEAGGQVTWEHHIVPLPPGPSLSLTTGERDALKKALGAWLEANPDGAWQVILEAL